MMKEVNLEKYGEDAKEAWSIYAMTGSTEKIADVIRERMKTMNPKLTSFLFIFALTAGIHK